MQVIFEADEAWSLMTIMVSQVLDQVELSDEGKNAVRGWRANHGEGTSEMADLTVSINEVMGTVLDERTTRLIRRTGWYVSTRPEARE
jgi:hypothetical protein